MRFYDTSDMSVLDITESGVLGITDGGTLGLTDGTALDTSNEAGGALDISNPVVEEEV